MLIVAYGDDSEIVDCVDCGSMHLFVMVIVAYGVDGVSVAIVDGRICLWCL